VSAPTHIRNYPTWRFPDFQRLIQYQAPADPQGILSAFLRSWRCRHCHL